MKRQLLSLMCTAFNVCFAIALIMLICTAFFVVKSNNFASANKSPFTAQQSALASVEHLARVMDQYHDSFKVYEDVSSAGNHFPVAAKIPSGSAPVTLFGSSTNNPHSGATAIRNQLCVGGGAEGGYYFQNGILSGSQIVPQPNFGNIPNAGITELTGATRLTFWARGEQGGEKIDFFMGGVGRHPVTGARIADFPDSTPRRPTVGSIFTLSANWQQFSIDLTGADLSYVLGGFGWYATLANNPNGAVFYLDDIQYELNEASRAQRLNQPRFLRSFTTLPSQSQPLPVGDFDLRFRNTAFIYDNALALLAFLADGTQDSLRRAKLIGDAFVYASMNDRFFNDGRLRNAYAAGDLALPPGWTPNGRVGTAAIAGFYTETQPGCFQNQTSAFTEVEQESTDTGNNAWAGIALLELYRRTSDPDYLTAANRLGAFIQTFKQSSGNFKGFRGGVEFPENPNQSTCSQDCPQPNPNRICCRRVYASSEHNLDIYANFVVMNRLTGQPQWQMDAQHAQQLVEAMWDAQRGCYWAGTINPSARNEIPGNLPLDVQAWSVLALPYVLNLHPQLLNCAEQNHRLTHDGFTGYDFNDDKDGVWFEGTAQMATAYKLAGQPAAREFLLEELRRAQQMPPSPALGDQKGLVAACHDGVSSGFGFSYNLRLHTGATAWNVFAQLGANPYYLVNNPTAAHVEVGGRVMTAAGRGIKNVLVSITDSKGNTRVVSTGLLGYYRFASVPTGETYVFSVMAKRYLFSQPSQIRTITEETGDINFTAQKQIGDMQGRNILLKKIMNK